MRAPIKPGNLEVHWPEGMSLLAGDAIDPDSMEPDYNATVTVEPLVMSEHASAAVDRVNGGRVAREADQPMPGDDYSPGATNLNASATSLR